MASQEEITHMGRIVDINPEFTTVEIISESACAACHAKGLCGVGESKVKTVQVRTSAWEPHQIGDEVEVALRKVMGYKAVFIAYGLPLIVLVAALLISSAAGAGELASGLIAIGSVVLCYIVLAFFRNRLRNIYSFYIK